MRLARRILAVSGPVDGFARSRMAYVRSGRPTLRIRFDAPVVVTLQRGQAETRYEGSEIEHLLPRFRGESVRLTVEGTAHGYAEIGA